MLRVKCTPEPVVELRHRDCGGIADGLSLRGDDDALSRSICISDVRCHNPIGGPVAEFVGIEVGVVSGVMNLESSGVEASDWRLRHDQGYHEA